MTERVFVYGSLKRGGPLHDIIDGAKFLGTGLTVNDSYHMLDLGPFPAVVKGGDNRIMGELFEVTDELLRQLDIIECGAGYKREEVATIDGYDAGDPVKAWLYMMTDTLYCDYPRLYPQEFDSNVVCWNNPKDYAYALSNPS